MSGTLEELVGCEVVLDTSGPIVYLGKLTRIDERGFWLEDADLHNTSEGHATRERSKPGGVLSYELPGPFDPSRGNRLEPLDSKGFEKLCYGVLRAELRSFSKRSPNAPQLPLVVA